MKKNLRTGVSLVLLSFSLLMLSGCVGSSTPAPTPMSVSFQAAPPASLNLGASTAPIVATVNNDPSNAGVDWNVSCAFPASNCGSFTPAHTDNGMPTIFTAPTALPGGNSLPGVNNTVNITALATANHAISSTVIVNILSNVTVMFSQPPPSSLPVNKSATFVVTVTNDPTVPPLVNLTLNCSSQGNCGSLSTNPANSGATVTYTAPGAIPSGNSVSITATSVFDIAKTATATITIQAPSSLTVNWTPPNGAPPQSLPPAAQATVSATVTGDPSNAGVNWTIGSCGQADCGMIAPSHTDSGASATYTAPASLPSGTTTLPVTITATAAADSTGATFISATITIVNPANISVAFTEPPPSSIETSGQATILAAVMSDPTNAGVTWSVSCTSGGAACGAISTVGVPVTSGNPPITTSTALYTAPSTVPSGNQVTIIATATATVASSTPATATQAVTITSLPGLINGFYAFSLTGNDTNGFFAAAGSLATDGNGGVTGKEDFIDASTSATYTVTTGTYSIGTDGRGTMNLALALSTGTGSITKVQTFSFTVATPQHVLISEQDTGATASGVLDLQDPTSFSSSSLSGAYSFLFTGFDALGSPVAFGGVLTANSGNFTGTEDENDGGQLTQGTSVTGSYTAPDSSGRGTATIGSSTFVYYIVNSGGLKFLETDTNNFTTAGFAFAQGSAPPSALPSAGYVFTVAGEAASTSGPPVPLVAGGLFVNNNGSLGAGIIDVNNLAAVPPLTSKGGFTGAASAVSNGRGTLTFMPSAFNSTGGLTQFAFYLTATQEILLLELDNAGSATGTALPQQPLISAASFNGTYAFSFEDAGNQEGVVGQILSNPATSIIFTSPPPPSLPPGTTATLSATITSIDPNVVSAGVDWKVTCSGNPSACGSFNLDPAHTANGASITYTAPPAIPPGGSVSISATVTATESWPTPVTVSAQVTISASGVALASGSSVTIDWSPGGMPPASLQTNNSVIVAATTANDAAGVVNWTVACLSSDCGHFSPTSTTSPDGTTYFAPATAPSGCLTGIGPCVTITASVQDDPSVAITATVQITSTLTGSVDINNARSSLFPLTPGVPVAGSFNGGSNGRFSGNLMLGASLTAKGVFYVASPETVFFIETDATPSSGSLQLQQLVNIAFSPAPPASLQAGTGTATVSATVIAPDPSIVSAGVDWNATCSGSGSACGSFVPTPAHTASGASITYNAPASVPSSGSVTIGATATGSSSLTGWSGGTSYFVGQTIKDTNNNVEKVTTAGTSGATQPSWASVFNQTTTDNTVVWTNVGPVRLATVSAPVTITAAGAVTVAITQQPASSVVVNGTTTVVATVTNDSKMQGVTWTLACAPQGNTCGSITGGNPQPGSGTTYTVTATYTAPPSAPCGNLQVTITATAIANSSATATANTLQVTNPPITMSLGQPNPSTVQANGGTATIAATLTNDVCMGGVSWTLSVSGQSCNVSSCGSIAPQTTQSGIPATYMAPPNQIPATITVTITATAVATINPGPPLSQSTTIIVTPAPITINWTSGFAPPASMQTNASATVSASVQNDTGSGGVNWTVSCNSSDCGHFSATTTTSGGSNTYFAPTTVPSGCSTGSGPCVTITATVQDASTVSISATVQITSSGRADLLNGQYAFLVTGIGSDGSYTAVAASVVADGKGNITSGELDGNDGGAPETDNLLLGNYTIGSDGRGSMTLTTNQGTFLHSFSFTIVDSTHAVITEFDHSATASGTLHVQNTSSFNFNSGSGVSGNYSFVASGIDLGASSTPFGAPAGFGGILNVVAGEPGNFTGTLDENDGGAITKNTSLSGTMDSGCAADSRSLDSFGRGEATFTFGSVTSCYLYYIVDAGTLFLLEEDGNFLTAGWMFAQASSPSLAAGTYAFTLATGSNAAANPTLGTLVAGGLFTVKTTSGSSGSISNGGALDINSAGAIQNGAITGGSFDQTSGRGTLTLLNNTGLLKLFGIYLTASHGVLLLDLDKGLAGSGVALAQSATVFQNKNYAINFQSATSPLGDSSGEEDVVGMVTSDGSSTLTGSNNAEIATFNGTNVTQTSGSLSGSFATSSLAGRFTGTLDLQPSGSSTQTLQEIFYIVDTNTVLFIEMDGSGQAAGILLVQQF